MPGRHRRTPLARTAARHAASLRPALADRERIAPAALGHDTRKGHGIRWVHRAGDSVPERGCVGVVGFWHRNRPAQAPGRVVDVLCGPRRATASVDDAAGANVGIAVIDKLHMRRVGVLLVAY